jgi:Flp pilus assembly pilin Flp
MRTVLYPMSRNVAPRWRRERDETGQATAEYALLTGAVALILGLVAAWAAGTGKVAALLDAVFDGLIGAAG